LLSADDVIRLLALKPHPEGGHYRETFRDLRVIDGRAASHLLLIVTCAA
jgi:predicted cupin superfamily sugar epimerase